MLPSGEYLWFEEQNFYELEPEIAVLAMFNKDKEMNSPLTINWDKAQGQLNLQGIMLPTTYVRWLWALSKPDSNSYKIRYFPLISCHLVEAAFKRLGCTLV
ncbi:hypothetical protein [Scytonema sp. NUACC26]|uniref:hypothetical protein n=1 Tax=Scytonema sp. NUACC26 TaxID=3140176 RepID=UPI0034DBAF8D